MLNNKMDETVMLGVLTSYNARVLKRCVKNADFNQWISMINNGADIISCERELILLAVKYNQLRFLEYLNSKGCNIQKHTKDILKLCAKYNNCVIAKWFITNDDLTQDNRTHYDNCGDKELLSIAVKYHSLDMVKLLIENGSDIDSIIYPYLYGEDIDDNIIDYVLTVIQKRS